METRSLSHGAHARSRSGLGSSQARLLFSPDRRTLYATADDNGRRALFAVDIARHAHRNARRAGPTSAISRSPDSDFIFARDSLKSPAQLYTSGRGRPRTRIDGFNDARLNVVFSDFEPLEFKGWNGDTVHGYVMKPYGFEAGNVRSRF